MDDFKNTRAPKGKIYQCQACGKKSVWAHGFTKKGDYCDWGFDVSCVMNAILVKEEPKNETRKT